MRTIVWLTFTVFCVFGVFVQSVTAEKCKISGIKALGEYAKKKQVKCFKKKSQAEKNGYIPLQIPTAAPTASPTPTPEVSFSGTWSTITDGDLEVVSDDCDDEINIPAAIDIPFSKTVTHDGALAYGEDNGGISDGRISGGAATSAGFTLKDRNLFDEVVACDADTTEKYTLDTSDPNSTKLNLVRTVDVTCSGSNKNCTQKWSGDVYKNGAATPTPTASPTASP